MIGLIGVLASAWVLLRACPSLADAIAEPPPSFDRLYKGLLQRQVEALVAIYLPRVYPLLDWSNVEHLSAELVPTRSRQRLLLADIVIKVGVRQPASVLAIVIHIEVQATIDLTISLRVHEYDVRIADLHGLPILSIVLQVAGAALAKGVDLVRWSRWPLLPSSPETPYHSICLPALEAIDYLERPEALNGLLALSMRRPAGVSEQDFRLRCLMKCAQGTMRTAEDLRYFLEIIQALYPLDPKTLSGYIDTMMQLAASEEDRVVFQGVKTLTEQLYEARNEARTAQHEAEEARRQAAAAAEIAAEQRILLRAASHKFGALPVDVLERIMTTTDSRQLSGWLDRVLDAATIADMEW